MWMPLLFLVTFGSLHSSPILPSDSVLVDNEIPPEENGQSQVLSPPDFGFVAENGPVVQEIGKFN